RLRLETRRDVHDEDDEIGEAASAVAEVGECLVAGRIDEEQPRDREVYLHPLREVPGELVYVLLRDVARAYHLRDTARLLLCDCGPPDAVEQGRLAVVDMAEYADYRRALEGHKNT